MIPRRSSLVPFFVALFFHLSYGFQPVSSNAIRKIIVTSAADSSSDPTDVAKDAIANADIMVFSKSTCP